MTIETKYNYGDTVWYINENKVAKSITTQFLVECKYKGGTAYSWGSTAFPIEIFYIFKPNSDSTLLINEKYVFPSKEELLKSL